MRYLTSGKAEAYAALLLTQLPNLQELRIWSDDSIIRWHLRTRLTRPNAKTLWNDTILYTRNVCSLSYLQNLQNIHISSLPFSVLDLKEVLALPSLRSLRVSDVFEPQNLQTSFEEVFCHGTSSVSELHFTLAALSFECLKAIILSSRELKKFVYNCPQAC
jgi:hypothetical protein